MHQTDLLRRQAEERRRLKEEEMRKAEELRRLEDLENQVFLQCWTEAHHYTVQTARGGREVEA